MKTRLPLLLLLALMLVALPALAQKASKAKPILTSSTGLMELKVLDPAMRHAVDFAAMPDLTCAIEVYDLGNNGVAVQNGGGASGSSFRIEISATVHGAEKQGPLMKTKLTYNWARNGEWQRPTTNPWSDILTFDLIRNRTTVLGPTFRISPEWDPGDKIKIVATINADKTVPERDEQNNTCSFEFTRMFFRVPLE